MQNEFDAALERLSPTEVQQCRYLVAVSGGIDSMCMADLFLHSSLKPSFAVAHVNFSLRGECSDGDQQHVSDWCQANGIEFHTITVDTHSYASRNSVSTQMAARDLRYNWFRSLMEEKGFNCLAIAHNLNDSVETFFLNLLRGTGIRGLSGIREVNGAIIRPLMCFTRAQIEEYMTEAGLAHREDATNSESHYSRNRIRNEVFPNFRIINPSFLATISSEMKRFSQIEDILDELYSSRKGTLYTDSPDGTRLIDIDALKAQGHTGYWLFRILDGYGFNDAQLCQIEMSLDAQSGKSFLSQTHKLVRDREYLKIYRIGDMDSLPRLKVRKVAKDQAFNPKELPSGTLCVDAAKVSSRLSVRYPKAGDRFRPFGMKGFKLLSDYFTDLKLDVEQKKRQVVVTCLDKEGAEQIVAIAGRRIDDRFKVTSRTRTVILFSL